MSNVVRLAPKRFVIFLRYEQGQWRQRSLKEVSGSAKDEDGAADEILTAQIHGSFHDHDWYKVGKPAFWRDRSNNLEADFRQTTEAIGLWQLLSDGLSSSGSSEPVVRLGPKISARDYPAKKAEYDRKYRWEPDAAAIDALWPVVDRIVKTKMGGGRPTGLMTYGR